VNVRRNSTGADFDEASLSKEFERVDLYGYLISMVRRLLAPKSGIPRRGILVFTRFVKEAEMLTNEIPDSAVVNLQIIENGQKKRLAYTGDIGRPYNRILRPPTAFPQCDYLITESTYGNRLHSSENEKEEDLLKIVVETCVEKKGKLIIPSFSIGRTQEIIFVLNKLYNERKLPHIEVFVDSPLSVNATDVFRIHSADMNDEVKNVLTYDSDPFGFNSLRYIKKVEESKALNDSDEPCIIISSSGMAEAGRVKHHIANNVSNWRNTILMACLFTL
jgi:metallo-beta-lactamase family protein